VPASQAREQRYGRGLGTQEAAVRAYCKQNGLRLVSVARDEAKSGSNGLDTRVGLAEALPGSKPGRNRLPLCSWCLPTARTWEPARQAERLSEWQRR